MKVTDYCPRAAPFDTHLKGRDLIGVEVGVDVGAHAEALLTYCPVSLLHLVDPWPNSFMRGYCDGRLSRFRGRYVMHTAKSLEFADKATIDFDFVYLDQEHDGSAVTADLTAWWPMVKRGGVLGHRNYAQERGSPLDRAIEAFVAKHKIETKFERSGNDIILLKP